MPFQSNLNIQTDKIWVCVASYTFRMQNQITKTNAIDGRIERAYHIVLILHMWKWLDRPFQLIRVVVHWYRKAIFDCFSLLICSRTPSLVLIRLAICFKLSLSAGHLNGGNGNWSITQCTVMSELNAPSTCILQTCTVHTAHTQTLRQADTQKRIASVFWLLIREGQL